MDALQDVLKSLLSNLASRKEIDQYLREFTGVDSAKFAVIKVGGGILRERRAELASSLAFLRRVGLFPIVVHGAGPQLNEALAEASIETSVINGLRVTSPDVLHVARRVINAENRALVEALEQQGTRARPISSGVFEASHLDADRLGLVGAIDRVHLEPVEAAIRAGQLPIVACLGESRSGQILNVNADVAARALALAVRPYKLIFLTPTGGLLDARGEIIPAINLVEDYDRLVAEPWVAEGMLLKLREIKHLLDELPASSSVSITSPDHLARELFTHRGLGTLVRRGEPIDVYASRDSGLGVRGSAPGPPPPFQGGGRGEGSSAHSAQRTAHSPQPLDNIDLERLRCLIETGFGHPLRDDYFETRRIDRIYLARAYSAAAIITTEGDTPYLDKFAVTAEAQGAGLGASLWSRLRQETPQLFWRARPGNPVNPWYFRQADGTQRTDDWIVFWYGLPSRDRIAACIERAGAIAPSIEYDHDLDRTEEARAAVAAGA